MRRAAASAGLSGLVVTGARAGARAAVAVEAALATAGAAACVAYADTVTGAPEADAAGVGVRAEVALRQLGSGARPRTVTPRRTGRPHLAPVVAATGAGKAAARVGEAPPAARLPGAVATLPAVLKGAASDGGATRAAAPLSEVTGRTAAAFVAAKMGVVPSAAAGAVVAPAPGGPTAAATAVEGGPSAVVGAPKDAGGPSSEGTAEGAGAGPLDGGVRLSVLEDPRRGDRPTLARGVHGVGPVKPVGLGAVFAE